MSTADNKFTAASIYAMENRHHAHSCSRFDFATRAFFNYLEVDCVVWCVAPTFLCAMLLVVTVFQSPVACSFLFGVGEFIGVRPPLFMFNSALSVRD